MNRVIRYFGILAFLILCFGAETSVRAQSSGTSGSVGGTVVDPSGAVVVGATVEVQNPVSGFTRTDSTDSSGSFIIHNVPFNPYHLTVTANGFDGYVQDVSVNSTVPILLKISLKITGTSTEVRVESSGADLLETDSTAHTDVDRALFEKLPLESASSSLSSLVTLLHSGNCGGFEWSVSWARRPRIEFIFHRRPTDHRSAKQGVFESTAGSCCAIHGSD